LEPILDWPLSLFSMKFLNKKASISVETFIDFYLNLFEFIWDLVGW
jgi:hypothetical protein